MIVILKKTIGTQKSKEEDKERASCYLVQDEAFPLSSSAADRDDSERTFEKMECRDGLGIHVELPVFIGINQSQCHGVIL